MPDLLLPVSFLPDEAMVRQHQSFVVSHHSHLSVEEGTSSKIQQSEAILGNWVVLYVDPVVLAFVGADPHVG